MQNFFHSVLPFGRHDASDYFFMRPAASMYCCVVLVACAFECAGLRAICAPYAPLACVLYIGSLFLLAWFSIWPDQL